MVIAFFAQNGLKHYRTGIPNDERHTAHVVIDRQRITKNRYGRIDIRLNIDQITNLPRMTLSQLEQFFKDIQS